MERRGRKGPSCARSEEMERAGDKQKKMVGYCSTGQRPQQAVMLLEEEYVFIIRNFSSMLKILCSGTII
jgi:hypothetical protein